MYSFTSHVRFSEIDETGRLSIFALVNYLQDCSTFHSESLGLGPSHVSETGLAWLLSAWQIEVRELPSFNDEIRVSTWATSFKGLRATRNFTVCRADDEAGESPLVRADSSWFMFDTKAGRPMRIPAEESEPYLIGTEADTPLDLPRIPRCIKVASEGIPASPVQVSGAHIDTNHHVNNAQYVSLALGAIEELEGHAAPVSWFDVHYSVAAKLGDTICPHVHHEPDGSTIVTLDDTADKPYALVRIR